MISGGQKAIASPMLREMTPFCCRNPLTSAAKRAGLAPWRLAGLVGDQFDGGDQADAADLSDERMRSELAQPFLHVRADRTRIADKVALLDQLEILQRHGRGDGMAAAGEAMPERADAVALVGDRLEHLLIDQQGRDRQIGRRDLLRQ